MTDIQGGVKLMFDRIAPTYDLVNRTMSLGIDQRWRARAIRSLRCDGPILDLCAGTLDLAAALAKSHRVIAVDFSAEMLERGKSKAPTVERVVADAKELPFDDATFGGAICGFGVRNIGPSAERDLAVALGEVRRVLRPGGAFVTLEFFKPVRAATRAFHRAFEKCSPVLGGAIARDREAYAYLARSILHFQTREAYESLLRFEGFVNVGGEDLTLGVASIVRGEKP
jgi:ubiquinone/menaquinone biosynthesis methyltransferase